MSDIKAALKAEIDAIKAARDDMPFGLSGETEEMLAVMEDALKALSQRDAQIAALTAENVALKSFFMTAIELSFQGCDFDGGYINDHALQLGLIREVFYSKDQHENLVYDAGNFEDGDPVYFINETPVTDAAANALRAEGAASVGTLIRACAHEFPSHVDDIVEECAMIADNRAINLCKENGNG